MLIQLNKQLTEDTKRTEQNKRFAFKSRQANHFFICDKIELIKDGVVLCQILVFV